MNRVKRPQDDPAEEGPERHSSLSDAKPGVAQCFGRWCEGLVVQRRARCRTSFSQHEAPGVVNKVSKKHQKTYRFWSCLSFKLVDLFLFCGNSRSCSIYIGDLLVL